MDANRYRLSVFAFLISLFFSSNPSFACTRMFQPGAYNFAFYMHSHISDRSWVGIGEIVKIGRFRPTMSSCISYREAKVKLIKILRGKKKLSVVDALIPGEPRIPTEVGDKFIFSGNSKSSIHGQPISEEGDFEEKLVTALAKTNPAKDKISNIQSAYNEAIDEDTVKLRNCTSSSVHECTSHSGEALSRLFSQIFWTEDSPEKIQIFCPKFDFGKENQDLNYCVTNAAQRLGVLKKEAAMPYCESFEPETKRMCTSAVREGMAFSRNEAEHSKNGKQTLKAFEGLIPQLKIRNLKQK